MYIYHNIIKVLKSPLGIIGVFFGGMTILLPSFYFIQKDLIIGNLGHSFYIMEIVLTIVISILFGLFIGSTLYKIKYFQVKKTGAGFIGGFFGVLVSGCPACSVTLASYIGLASIISTFPYYGMELKFLSVFMLIYANYATLKTLELCNIQVKD
ncbi:hypothetical protein A9Q91_02780 [Candidatus Gracilibacteria bacterium 28_42_T64]|nr:hypothetical protein A9Q91_02780 [Candidatus Gracilibacteria bacterium 28_42_T64]